MKDDIDFTELKPTKLKKAVDDFKEVVKIIEDKHKQEFKIENIGEKND